MKRGDIEEDPEEIEVTEEVKPAPRHRGPKMIGYDAVFYSYAKRSIVNESGDVVARRGGSLVIIRLSSKYAGFYESGTKLTVRPVGRKLIIEPMSFDIADEIVTLTEQKKILESEKDKLIANFRMFFGFNLMTDKKLLRMYTDPDRVWKKYCPILMKMISDQFSEVLPCTSRNEEGRRDVVRKAERKLKEYIEDYGEDSNALKMRKLINILKYAVNEREANILYASFLGYYKKLKDILKRIREVEDRIMELQGGILNP